jgi:hypothetical protein
MNALEFLLNIKYAGVTPVTSFDWTPILISCKKRIKEQTP